MPPRNEGTSITVTRATSELAKRFARMFARELGVSGHVSKADAVHKALTEAIERRKEVHSQ